MNIYSWIRRSLPLSGKNFPADSTTASSLNNNHRSKENEEVEIYGITEELVEFVKSFTLDTFKNFSLLEEESDKGKQGNVSNDLSRWQEKHAMLILSKVKELSQLRFRLCPGYLKDGLFWRIYFKLVWNYITEYELNAIRLAKLKEMAFQNVTEADKNTIEVEMSESKMTITAVKSSSSEDL